MMQKRMLPLVLILCVCLALSGCGHEFDSYRPIDNVSNLEGRKVGVTLAWASDYVLSPRDGKDLILYRYDTTADMLMALFYHQIDAICIDMMEWLIMEKVSGDGMCRLEEPVTMDGYVAYMSPQREALRDDFNRFLAYWHDTEEFTDLTERMSRFDGVHYEPPECMHPNGKGEKIRLAFSADFFPYCYSEPDGTVRGYDIEIMYAFADYCGYEIELIESSITDVTHGVLHGLYDMGIGTFSKSYVSETEYNGVHTTDTYYEVPLYLVELTDSSAFKINDVYLSY